MILGREQSLTMKCVDFPQIHEPTINAKPDKAIKAVQNDPAKAATIPVTPVVQSSTNCSITINGKTHQLPSTKEYLLREY